jgi:acetyl esterase/lipase
MAQMKHSPSRLLIGMLVLMLCPLAVAEQPTSPPTKTFQYKKIKQGELEMIVHYPPDWKEGDKRPAIVFFFGGGWTSGTVKQFETQASYLASRGMVAARADYRVKSRQGVTPKQCVEDAKSAVRWIRQNAAKLGIDPDRIVAAGGSAGGHLAACTGLVPGLDAEGEDTKISSQPNAMVLFNPVLRLDDPKTLKYVGNDEAIGKALSPTLYLTKTTPPVLMLYGTADPLKAQGDEFMAKAKELGLKAEMFTADGQNHGFFNRPPWLEKTTQRMSEFLVEIGYLESAKAGNSENGATSK